MMTPTPKGKTPPCSPSCAAKPTRPNTERAPRARAYGSSVGKLLALLALMLIGCAVGDAETPRPRVEANACYESFQNVLEGWEALVGPVPERCQHLDETVAVHLTSAPMPCKGSDPGRVVGCFMAEEGEPLNEGDIYITSRHTDETQRVDTSVHEWVHALAYCVRSSGNPDHDDHALWGAHPHEYPIVYDPKDVKSYAVVTSALGPCLGSPK